MILYWFIYPIKYYSEILTHPDFHERHWLLFFEFNQENLKNLFFYAYFIIHRISFAFIIAAMSSYPLHQWILVWLVNLWMLIYSFRVYNSWLHNFLHIFNWFILLMLSWMLPWFLDSNDSNKLKISGYVSKNYAYCRYYSYSFLNSQYNLYYF